MIRKPDPFQVGNASSDSAPRPSLETHTPPTGKEAWQNYVAVDSEVAQDRGSIEVLSDIISLIWLRLGLVATVTLGISMAICLYAFTQPRIFQSSAEVNLSPAADTSNMKKESRTKSQGAAHISGQMRLLTSSPFIGRFIDSRQVSDLSESCETHHGILHLIGQVVSQVSIIAQSAVHKATAHTGFGNWLHSAEAGATGNLREEAAGSAKILERKSLIAAFGKALTVKPAAGVGGDSGIVEVSFNAYLPEAAQRALQAYLAFYGQVMRDGLRTDLEAQRSALKERSAEAEQNLIQSERTIAEFEQAHEIFPQGNYLMGPVLNLVNRSVERIVEAREEKERIRSLSLLDTGSATPAFRKTGDVGTLTALKQQLAQLEAHYAEQATVYSASFPKMSLLQREITRIGRKLDATTKEARTVALESADLEEKVREQTLDQARKDATRMNSLQAPYAGLRRKVETNTLVYQKILSALEDVNIQLAAIPAGLSIIEPPSLVSAPVASRRGLMVAIGIALGLLCGVGVASVTESLADSSRVLNLQKTAVDIHTRPLGIVPDFATFNGMGSSKNPVNTSPLFFKDASGNPVSHIIKDIEASLYFSASEALSRVTLVSSAIAGEGKTFLAASLACAMSSRESQKTLVLDADMRRPALHKVFGHEAPGAGLSTVLTDRNTVLSRIIRRSQVPGLFYLTAGPVPEDPLALLRSKRFLKVLCALEKYFDNIVIDSPPVLSVPDYMPLCHVVKKVILVVKQGKTLREEVRECAKLIRCVTGTRIFGVILNRAQTTAGRFRSGERHHSQYHCRYEDRYQEKVS